MRLGQYATGRDNNFNLVRFIAAFAVLWSHSYAIVISPAFEPWVQWLGYTPGGVAVDVFFVTSGFLVTASLMRLDNFRAFARARALRIFPALLVMSLLLALVMGPLLTTRPLDVYFSDSAVWKFIWKNSTILTGVKYSLPGVFENNHMQVVNGSLWTLPFELRCYLTLALVWWLASFVKSDKARMFTRIVVVGTALMLVSFWVAHHYAYKHWHTFRLFYFFFLGAAMWIYRARIPMSGTLFAVACVALIGGIVQPKTFFWIYPLTVPYIVMWLAYVPGGVLRQFNKLGDYSYGIYIYAFPIQQALVATVPGITPEQMIAAAGAGTVALAVLSWHLVEKPMLARKKP
ncbi:Acyltransferase 3 [Lysobacter dokdonensis DS-58]|uniref:Acyltransferase 3 n=1 Tax=Lysobacter dokdonensis DS-58 TaxID=1300345 RepID=A0A0A2WKX4_9GAMM|nr:acyltransferase [Lysobacter dokdonensis]KGQ20831.1 Acyltransferase 3 [Lysobacter dokdonensis DS-58]